LKRARRNGSVFDQQAVMIKAYDQQQQFMGITALSRTLAIAGK